MGDFGHQVELQALFAGSAQAPYGVVIRARPDGQEAKKIVYDPATQEIMVDKTRSTLLAGRAGLRILRGKLDTEAFGEPLDWRVFVDGSVVDVFLGHGAALSFRIYPSRGDVKRMGLVAQDTVAVDTATVWRLKVAKIDYDFKD